MTKNRYDVIVVGGGPAGGTAAYELARRGVRVLLLEKEHLPRYKPCAGGLPLKAAQLLGFDVSPAYETEVTKARCTYKGGSAVSMDFGRVVGWTVMRDQLDYLIVNQALKAGAEVMDGQRVRDVEILPGKALVTTDGEEYAGLVVVGADGATGIVARSAGLMKKRRLAATASSEVLVSTQLLAAERGRVLFDFGTVPCGYGWVFPKKEHFSVGVATFLRKPQTLSTHLWNFLRTMNIPSKPQEVKSRGHLVPLGGVDLRLHRERVLLLGDAAGLAEPMTGEGICYAISSAKLAADTICQTLNDGLVDLSLYTSRINTEITREFRYAQRLARLLYRFPQLCFYFFARSPLVRYGIADVLCGDLTFRQLFHRLLKNSPGILLAGMRYHAAANAQ